MSFPQLVYIDTNVFATILLAHSQSQDPFVKKANNFILDIENGKYVGITSTLSEIEYRGTAKRRISEAKKSQISLQEEQSAMDNFYRFIRQIGIGLVDADLIAPGVSGKLGIFRSAGHTVKVSNPVYVSNLWKMIRSVDALMINVAILTGAKLFATFDQGFKGLKSSSIVPFIISDTY